MEPTVLETEREASTIPSGMALETSAEGATWRIWAGVVAGGAIGVGALAILHFLGRGLTIISQPGMSEELTWGSAIWWLLAVMPACAIAGLLAGALSRPVTSLGILVVGSLTWCAGMFIHALLLGIGAANVFGGLPSFLSGYIRTPEATYYNEFTAVAAWVILLSMVIGYAFTLVGTAVGSKVRTT